MTAPMPADSVWPETLASLSRGQLQRVAEEFRSERDAVKCDTLRAFDERNVALAELAHVRQSLRRLESAIVSWWEGRRPVGWSVAQHAANAAVNAHYPVDAVLADAAAAIATTRATEATAAQMERIGRHE